MSETVARPVSRGVMRALALLAAVALALVLARVIAGGFDPDGAAASDFAAFWVAGRMAMLGDTALAYDRAAFVPAVAAMLGATPNPMLAWLNPPGFLVLLLPFALLPFAIALALWSVGGALLLAGAAWVALRRWDLAALVLVTPAAVINLVLGQNGALVAALMTLCLAWLDRRPVLAGICLGLLSIKPQFGLIFPLLLLVGGQWRAFGSAAAVTLGLAAVSLAWLGPAAWHAFLDSLPANAALVFHPPPGTEVRLQSILIAMLRGGAGPALAWGTHAVVAGVALLLAAWLWRCRDAVAMPRRAVAAMAAAFLATPYMFPYDGVALGVAAALLLTRPDRRPGVAEACLCLGAILLPVLPVFLPVHGAVPLAWLVMLGLAMLPPRAAN